MLAMHTRVTISSKISNITFSRMYVSRHKKNLVLVFISLSCKFLSHDFSSRIVSEKEDGFAAFQFHFDFDKPLFDFDFSFMSKETENDINNDDRINNDNDNN